MWRSGHVDRKMICCNTKMATRNTNKPINNKNMMRIFDPRRVSLFAYNTILIAGSDRTEDFCVFPTCHPLSLVKVDDHTHHGASTTTPLSFLRVVTCMNKIFDYNIEKNCSAQQWKTNLFNSQDECERLVREEHWDGNGLA